MKNYFHEKAVDIPLYRGKLVIILSNNMEQVKSTVECFDKDELFAHSCLRNYKGIQGFFIILNFDNSFAYMTYGIITHEIVHTTGEIADARGIVPDFDNDEPLAYLAEWIAEIVYEFVESKGFKLKHHTK